MQVPNLKLLIGGHLAEIELVEPISWWFRFSAGGAIRADTLWRLVHRGTIHTTSYDHGHPFGLPEPVDSANEGLRAIGGSTVRDVRLVPETGDLWIEFENDSRVEILTTSASYESWSVFLPNGDEIIGLGGGEVQLLKRDS